MKTINDGEEVKRNQLNDTSAFSRLDYHAANNAYSF